MPLLLHKLRTPHHQPSRSLLRYHGIQFTNGPPLGGSTLGEDVRAHCFTTWTWNEDYRLRTMYIRTRSTYVAKVSGHNQEHFKLARRLAAHGLRLRLEQGRGRGGKRADPAVAPPTMSSSSVAATPAPIALPSGKSNKLRFLVPL